MTTLHVENKVRDFESWKSVFDKFARFRADHGVRSYRMARQVDDPNAISIDLDFDTVAEAETFRRSLEKIWATPQSRDQVVGHTAAVIIETVEQRIL